MADTKKPNGVYAKILAVMGDVSHVGKDGFNKFQNYSYTSEYGILAVIRASMIEHGLVIIPDVLSCDALQVADTKAGQPQWITTVRVRYTFVDVDSGEKHVANFYGSGIDSGDKGYYKALTGANKYMFLKAFQLPSGDDPEKDEQKAGTTPPPKKSSATHPADLKKENAETNLIQHIEALEAIIFADDTAAKAKVRAEKVGDIVLDNATDGKLGIYKAYLEHLRSQK